MTVSARRQAVSNSHFGCEELQGMKRVMRLSHCFAEVDKTTIRHGVFANESIIKLCYTNSGKQAPWPANSSSVYSVGPSAPRSAY